MKTWKAVAYKAGKLVEVDAPAGWPGIMTGAISHRALLDTCDELSTSAIGRIGFYLHRESRQVVAVVYLDFLNIPIVLPTDLDVARFWKDFVHAAEVAENYGALGAAIEDQADKFGHLAESLQSAAGD